jgi:myo-inositol-1(or 4)-monophosphatase
VDRPPPTDLVAVAREAADAAAAVLLPRFGSERPLASKSSATDWVSEADLLAENAIREVLAARRPDDGILGEEGTGDVAGTSGLRWIVDPLDGTVNFLYGIPQWCVSIAVEDADRATLAGLVYDAVRDEAFTTLDDLPGSDCADLAHALVATGFGYESEVRRGQAAVAARVLPEVRDIRRAGSAALDLAWTAAGRVDAFYERGVKTWDVAAGLALCARAGHELRRLEGSPPGVLVAPPGIVDALASLVA